MNRLSQYVGNTPLIPITIGGCTVWGKCEFMNPSGSVKDRMATFIVNDAERRKILKRGSTLCEATLNIQAHYETTGPEIYGQYNMYNSPPDVFVAGTGTGGTLMGTTKYMKTKWKNMKVVAVEPAESPVMSGGKPGLHGIQGIGDGSKFLVDLDFVDDVSVIATDCAKAMTKHLAKKYGLFIGISGGANVFASFQWLRDNNKNNAITILCDRGERYFSCL